MNSYRQPRDVLPFYYNIQLHKLSLKVILFKFPRQGDLITTGRWINSRFTGIMTRRYHTFRPAKISGCQLCMIQRDGQTARRPIGNREHLYHCVFLSVQQLFPAVFLAFWCYAMQNLTVRKSANNIYFFCESFLTHISNSLPVYGFDHICFARSNGSLAANSSLFRARLNGFSRIRRHQKVS